MEIVHLRSFVAVARTGSISAAAAQMFVDVSAMSRRISQLEREAGGELFERGPSSVTLTELGRALLPLAEDAVHRFDVVLDAAESRSRGRPQSLTVAFPPMLHPVVRTRFLAAVASLDPPITVNLVAGANQTLGPKVRTGQVALALIHVDGLLSSDRERRDIGHLVIATEVIGVAVPAAAFPGDVTALEFGDLAGLEYLTSDNASAPAFYGRVNAFLQAAGVHKRRELPHHDGSTLLHWIATGRGFALCGMDEASISYRLFGNDPMVRVLPLKGEPLTLDTVLVWSQAHVGPSGLAVVDAVRRQAEPPILG